MLLPVSDWLANTLAGATVAVTLLPLVRRDAWWIRAWAFPRLQLLGLCLVALAAAAGTAEPASGAGLARLGSSAACTLAQALYILPFTPFWRRQVASGDPRVRTSLGILIANVLMDNRDAAALISRVRELDPDLVLLVETDDWWQRATAELRVDYPYTIEEPLPNTYGMMFYSRLPLRDAEVRYLIESDVPSVRCRVELPQGDDTLFVGLHPKPPVPTEATRTTTRDAELLLVARELCESPSPAIVAGDLNDVAWSYTTRLFRRISGLLDPRIGRGLYSTFPAHRPWLRFPLDHIFHSPHFVLGRMTRARPFGSDHLPIFARLIYQPRARHRQSAEAPDGDDLELAREKVEKGLAEEAADT